MSAIQIDGIRFYPAEIKDLAIAWLALGLAFGIFVFVTTGREVFPDITGALFSPLFARVFFVNLVTVGIGFLLHELAHKIVAVRFGQIASFKADYKMLALCIGAAFAGFLFAAPGAVHHRGRITPRQNGLISVAGPVTNIALVAVFLPFVFFDGVLGQIGQLGVIINAFLAVFNMLPFGPLDGKSVMSWRKSVFAIVFVSSLLLAIASFLFVGFPTF